MLVTHVTGTLHEIYCIHLLRLIKFGINSNFNGKLLKRLVAFWNINSTFLPWLYLNIIYYYWYSALGPVWAQTRIQSGDWYGSGTLHPGQVLRGSLPLLSHYLNIHTIFQYICCVYLFIYIYIYIYIHTYIWNHICKPLVHSLLSHSFTVYQMCRNMLEI